MFLHVLWQKQGSPRFFGNTRLFYFVVISEQKVVFLCVDEFIFSDTMYFLWFFLTNHDRMEKSGVGKQILVTLFLS